MPRTVPRLPLLDPRVVSRLGGLEIIARLVVEGFLTGLHRSPYHGFSVEFAEHRPYMPGDEVRHVDWKVYGKTDRFYIKEFESETNLKAYIALDASRSMAYAGAGVSKLRYGVLLAATLAFLMIRQRDAVGLVIFDEGIRQYIPPRATRRHLEALLGALARVEPARRTGALQAFRELASRIRRRGLLIVISDLLTDPQEVLRGLRYFRHQKHEVLVFHLLDPHERRLHWGREVVLRDLETGEELPTIPWEIQRDYERVVAEWEGAYRARCREALIDYRLFTTEVPFEEALVEYLRKRERLG